MYFAQKCPQNAGNAVSWAVHTKIDLSWIDLRLISVRFEKVFTLI